MLNANLLAVHRAVVTEGSLTRAAAVLGYTVSAVSQQLATLEGQAGSELFERVGRGVRPTAAGRLLAEHAEGILHDIEQAELALADLRAGRAGRIRVVTFPSAGESLLPAAVADLRERLPGLRVRPAVAEAVPALRRLRAGEVDLVVVVEPFPPGGEPDDDLHRWHLLDDQYRLLVPHGHPLARRRRVRVEELSAADWVITMGPADYVARTTWDLCRRAGFGPRIVAESDEFGVTQGYVAAGMGVALAPLLALAAVRPDVAVRRLRPDPEPRHIWAATRSALATQQPVVAMVQALQAAAAGLAGGAAPGPGGRT